MEFISPELIEVVIMQAPNFLFALIFVGYSVWKDTKQDAFIAQVLSWCLDKDCIDDEDLIELGT